MHDRPCPAWSGYAGSVRAACRTLSAIWPYPAAGLRETGPVQIW